MNNSFCFVIIRRKQSERESDSRRTSVQLDDIARGSVDTTTSTANLVYQNVADIRQPQKGNLKCYLHVLIHINKQGFHSILLKELF